MVGEHGRRGSFFAKTSERIRQHFFLDCRIEDSVGDVVDCEASGSLQQQARPCVRDVAENGPLCHGYDCRNGKIWENVGNNQSRFVSGNAAAYDDGIDIEQCGSDKLSPNHGCDSQRNGDEDGGDHQRVFHNFVCHKGFRSANGKDVVVVERSKDDKNASAHENLKHDDGFVPFRPEKYMENRFGACDKQEGGGKEQICRESIHFAHGVLESLFVVLEFAEDGQKRRCENLRHRHDAHFAPFVGLRVASEFREIVVCAYYERVDV